MEKKWEFGSELPEGETPEGLVTTRATASGAQKSIATNTAMDLMCKVDGIPSGCTIELIGPAGCGKTRTCLAALVSALDQGRQCALVLSEEKFVNPENPGRPDVLSRLLEIGGGREVVAIDKLSVLESLSYDGNGWADFTTGYRWLVEKKGVKFTVIDSMSLIDRSNRHAASNMNALKVFNHNHGVTCIAIGQVKDGGVAGGEQIQHAADCVFLVDTETVNSKEMAEQYGCKYRDQIMTMKAVKSATTRVEPKKIRVSLDNESGILLEV
jgi:hypothetical protein